MILKFPEGGDNALRTCLDERVNDTRDALFSDWSDAGVAGRERDQAGIEMKIPNLAYLEQTVIRVLRLWSENESGAIWDFWIDIAVKGQVDHAVMAEWELLEVCLRGAGA